MYYVCDYKSKELRRLLCSTFTLIANQTNLYGNAEAEIPVDVMFKG